MNHKIARTSLLAIALLLVTAGGRVLYVQSLLKEKEDAIKQALGSAAQPEQSSNADDGAARFIDSGSLVLEPAYLLRSQKINELQLLNMRLSPRMTNGPNDGWVGIQNDHWYVKLH